MAQLHKLIDLGNSYLKRQEVNRKVVNEFLKKLLEVDSFFSLLKRRVKIFFVKFEELDIREARKGEVDRILREISKRRDPRKVKKLLGIRQFYRERKEWEKADAIREKLRELGVIINDLPQGFSFKFT